MCLIVDLLCVCFLLCRLMLCVLYVCVMCVGCVCVVVEVLWMIDFIKY